MTVQSHWMAFIEWADLAARQGSGLTAEEMTGAATFRSWLVNHSPEVVTDLDVDVLAQAMTEAATNIPGIYAEAVAIARAYERILRERGS